MTKKKGEGVIDQETRRALANFRDVVGDTLNVLRRLGPKLNNVLPDEPEPLQDPKEEKKE